MSTTFQGPAAAAVCEPSSRLSLRRSFAGRTCPLRPLARSSQAHRPRAAEASTDRPAEESRVQPPAPLPTGEPAAFFTSRRAFVAAAAAAAALHVAVQSESSARAAAVARSSRPRITDKVYISYRIGNQDVGRVEFGLYGDVAPKIVETFRSICTAKVPGFTYRGTLVHRVSVQGIEGGHIKGFKNDPPLKPFLRSADFRSASAFSVKHDRPGLLCTAISFDEPEYCGFEYIVTANPAPELEGSSIVFGEVTKGQDVLKRLSLVPVVQPNDNKAFWIDFGKKVLKDERAALAQAAIYKPLTRVTVSDCGGL